MLVASWISTTISTLRRMSVASFALRGFVSVAAIGAVLATTAPSWDAPDGYVAVAVAAAVVCVVLPDTFAALVLVLAIAACWLARAPGGLSPPVVLTALALLGVHVGTAVAAAFPATAAIHPAVLRRSARLLAWIAVAVVAATGVAALLEAWSRPGSIVVTVAALGAITVLAWWWAVRPQRGTTAG